MAKAVEANNIPQTDTATTRHAVVPEIDSKYRMIIIAAQRSKQLQRGARPRVEMDMARHKPTRIAIDEVLHGKVSFSVIERE
ncbi:MAG: DNA-directed RNA polymerase subunit omega [Pyrinomonadaceae bacterium]|nr:DNA-directed RNA polymerase subunit omega [Pyrinomonadaceae bacterium]